MKTSKLFYTAGSLLVQHACTASCWFVGTLPSLSTVFRVARCCLLMPRWAP